MERRRVKCDQTVLRLPVFFLSLYWFLAAYTLSNAVIFLRYSGDKTIGGFVRQLLLINITLELSTLLIAYVFILVVASAFAILTIYVIPARIVILIGGSIVGVCLAIFAFFMTVHLSAAPCEEIGCGDVDYKLFVVQLIYIIYGNFIASQIPIAYALRKEPCSVKEFFQLAFWPGVLALTVYTTLGLAIVYSVAS